MGIQKQKLPKVSPRKEGKDRLTARKLPFSVGLTNSFHEKCSVNSLSDAESSSTTLISDETSPSPSHGTSRVRFKCDANSTRIVGYPMPARKKELTLYEIKQTWWTRTELRKCRERAQDMCRQMLDNELEYKLAVVRILSRCGADQKPNIEAYQFYEQIFDAAQNQSLDDEAEDLKKIVDFADTARGLEKRMLNVMEVPFYRHKRSVQAVLDTQRKLREKEYSFIDMEREIASRYRRHCKYAATFACLVAECDATAAGIRAMI